MGSPMAGGVRSGSDWARGSRELEGSGKVSEFPQNGLGAASVVARTGLRGAFERTARGGLGVPCEGLRGQRRAAFVVVVGGSGRRKMATSNTAVSPRFVGVTLSFHSHGTEMPAYGLHTSDVAPKEKDSRPSVVSSYHHNKYRRRDLNPQ